VGARRLQVSAVVGIVVVGALGVVPAASAAALPRADLSVTRVSPATATVTLGELVTFRVVAVNNGRASSELNVGAIESQGLRLVRMTCADGVTADTPFCEYGPVPPGTQLVTRIFARVTNVQSGYAQVACASSSGDTIDPRPGNDCQLALLTLR
jgi:Domain of unknown function DUF11